jgi:hypothetical protein
MPRIQQQRFVARLRAAAFDDPLKLFANVSGHGAAGYLSRLWEESKSQVDRAASRLEQTGAAAARSLGPMTETAPLSEPLAVQLVRPTHGWLLAIVRLPPPQRRNETYFVGIAVPETAVARPDAGLAYRAVRFFVLNKWSHSRDTDLIEETRIGRTLTYNVGTGKWEEAFAEGIAERLRAGKPEWLAALEARQGRIPVPLRAATQRA